MTRRTFFSALASLPLVVKGVLCEPAVPGGNEADVNWAVNPPYRPSGDDCQWRWVFTETDRWSESFAIQNTNSFPVEFGYKGQKRSCGPGEWVSFDNPDSRSYSTIQITPTKEGLAK